MLLKKSTEASFTIKQAMTNTVKGIYLDHAGKGFLVGNSGLAMKIDQTTLTLVPVDAAQLPNKGTGIPATDLSSVTFTDNKSGYITAANNTVLKTSDGGDHWHVFGSKPLSSTGTPILALNSEGTGTLINGSGQVSSLKDGSDRFSSRFWYDELGRLCLSQTAKQFTIGKYLTPQDETKKAYSYTLYDEIGRIIEVGEIIAPETTALPLSGKNDNQLAYKKLQDFVTKSTRRDITNTYYDEAPFALNWEGQTIKQENLRTRVTSVTYTETSNDANYQSASHYSYDIHGNVKTLVQEVANKTLSKRLDYDYDLISGKVNTVTYQAGKTDQFIHRYAYDSDNRITKVFTSKDGVIWDNDAKYQYYAHGPLARATIGDKNLQTQNYAYTLQGWIKGVNGQDFSYALGYNANDYKPVVGTNTSLATPIAASPQSGAGLYNGNIATWASKNKSGDNAANVSWTQQFRYDQLNRITASTSITPDVISSSYTYDANGNLLTLNRTDAANKAFDAMRYNYENTASSNNYKQNTNKLRWVDDNADNTTKRDDDIDDQDVDNYAYDATGNLIADAQEKIKTIEWTAYGKVRSVTREANSGKYDLRFTYDASGNRVTKTATLAGIVKTTYYLRDASGNVMAVYEQQGNADANLAEQHIYGSSRIGEYKNTGAASTAQYVGLKNYELTDHLGNVRTVLSDKIIVGVTGADIAAAMDYYPFGMTARSFNSQIYRYSYNGKEIDQEGMGGGSSTYDYGFRIYNPALAKFLSVDPLSDSYPQLTPYQFASNTPIAAVDLDGLEADAVYDKGTSALYLIPDVSQFRPKLKTKYVNAFIYDKLTEKDREKYNYGIVVKNVFTGGRYNPETKKIEDSNPNHKDIPNGEYNILENKGRTDEVHKSFLVLDPVDDSQYDKKDENDRNWYFQKRTGYNLHPGQDSHGCVTINKTDNEFTRAERALEWEIVRKAIGKTKTTAVPDNRGWYPERNKINELRGLPQHTQIKFGKLKVIDSSLKRANDALKEKDDQEGGMPKDNTNVDKSRRF